MDWIFHLLGTCPDSLSHLDLIDVIFILDQMKMNLYNLIKIWVR
jgi:hypothetical protein